jgi:hypothetical protein
MGVTCISWEELLKTPDDSIKSLWAVVQPVGDTLFEEARGGVV